MAVTKGPKRESITVPTKGDLETSGTKKVVPQPMLQPGETHEHYMARFHDWYNTHNVESSAQLAAHNEQELLADDEKRSDTKGVADDV